MTNKEHTEVPLAAIAGRSGSTIAETAENLQGLIDKGIILGRLERVPDENAVLVIEEADPTAFVERAASYRKPDSDKA